MLSVHRTSDRTRKGDLIAFFRENEFIGYGEVADILGDVLVIMEDASIRNELGEIVMNGGTVSIEID